ncbi:MAG: hypothetical protein ABIP51_21570 [Bacteroidia bacterium]
MAEVKSQNGPQRKNNYLPQEKIETMEELLLKEKRDLKKDWSNKFLNDLEIILEKCFLMPKKKKEHFITKERLEVDLIRLLQSQNGFNATKNFKEELKNIAAFELNENVVSRIISLNIVGQTVEIENIHLIRKVLTFDEVRFFNFKTLELVVMFDKQKIFSDKFTYQDTYRFLMADNLRPVNESKKCISYGFERITPLTVKVDYGKGL